MTEIPISMWGNSAAIRLPKALMRQLRLRSGQKVRITVQDGKGVLEPVSASLMTPDWIKSEMDRLGPESNPETLDWGPDRGVEIVDEYLRKP